MADDAREKAIADNHRPTRPRSPRGCSVSANGSATSIPAVPPTVSPARSVRPPTASAIARGFRLSTELVAGVLVGAGIGWLLDRWLGISPWGMIVFLLLGFAAGVLNVMRAAGVAPTNTLDPPGRGNETAPRVARRERDEGRTDPVMDPIHQFEIKNLFTLGRIGGTEIAFTNSALFMVIALGRDLAA